MSIVKAYNRKIIKSSYAHHQYVENNKELFLSKRGLNSVQYMNVTRHTVELTLAELLYLELKKIQDHFGQVVFLNFCSDPGFLELCNTYYGNKLKISTFEFEGQAANYKAIRDYYSLEKINYFCNDFNESNFEIKKCKTYFNYIILKDFVKYWDIKDLKQALIKLKPYAKRSLVVERLANLSEEMKDFLNVKSSQIINITEDWNLYLVKTNLLDENV